MPVLRNFSSNRRNDQFLKTADFLHKQGGGFRLGRLAKQPLSCPSFPVLCHQEELGYCNASALRRKSPDHCSDYMLCSAAVSIPQFFLNIFELAHAELHLCWKTWTAEQHSMFQIVLVEAQNPFKTKLLGGSLMQRSLAKRHCDATCPRQLPSLLWCA